ncbi:phage tail protein [Pedobacter sp. L105]|uniref:phage tail protein n=1 Tax=Pedobacter sp. L105 TaxID=1641871 RepID=UPI001C207EF4|nr:tail fiber protein [Pedobacter sp. L105]
MDAFIGEIRAFGFNFNPQNWALCQGQILPIQQYSALFSILGVTYGGNGTTNFALPNIQGTVLNSAGQLPGGQNYSLGEVGGAAGVTLATTEIQAHSHSFSGAAPAGGPINEVTVPVTGSYIANSFAKANANSGVVGRSYAPVNPAPGATLNPTSIGIAGGSQPHNNMMPNVAINYCICLQGIFPSRP